jgi:hypothetical protein
MSAAALTWSLQTQSRDLGLTVLITRVPHSFPCKGSNQIRIQPRPGSHFAC